MKRLTKDSEKVKKKYSTFLRVNYIIVAYDSTKVGRWKAVLGQ